MLYNDFSSSAFHIVVDSEKNKYWTEDPFCFADSTNEQTILIELGFAAILVTAIVSLATVILIFFEQTNQIAALQQTLHSLCTQALLDAENTDSTAEDVSPQ